MMGLVNGGRVSWWGAMVPGTTAMSYGDVSVTQSLANRRSSFSMPSGPILSAKTRGEKSGTGAGGGVQKADSFAPVDRPPAAHIFSRAGAGRQGRRVRRGSAGGS